MVDKSQKPAKKEQFGEVKKGQSVTSLANVIQNFADHKGSYIRLAYSDALDGPWTVYPPGSLQLSESHFPTDPPEMQLGFPKGGNGIWDAAL